MKKQSILWQMSLMRGPALLFFALVLINSSLAATIRRPDTTKQLGIIDTIPPEITLRGSVDASICRWSIYTDAGYDVCDNYWDKKSIKVTREGSFADFNTLHEGLYLFRYKAVDSFGNVGYSDYRCVTVLKNESSVCGGGSEFSYPEFDVARSFSVYPNPNGGKFSIKSIMFNREIQFEVTNMYGKVILNMCVKPNVLFNIYNFDLSDYPVGMYMVCVICNKESQTMPFLDRETLVTKQVMITR